MEFEYEPALVEQAAFLAARRDPALECDLHLAVDPLYAIPDPELRQRAFEEAYSSLFTRMGLAAVLPRLVDEFPRLTQAVGTCVVREAPRGKAQSAELLGKPVENSVAYTLMIQLCPASLLDVVSLTPLMRRELLHASDIVDPDFGFVEEPLPGIPAQQTLIRERYRVLWDVYVEGRLVRAGRLDGNGVPKLRTHFLHAFSVRGGQASPADFDRIVSAGRLSHRQLRDWAVSPRSVLAAPAPASPADDGQVRALCPLCGFPTFDWYPFPAPGVVGVILQQRPDWNPQAGACRQCVETYLAGAPLRHPAPAASPQGTCIPCCGHPPATVITRQA